ncbi:MAG: response regulator [Chloroflexota bacterium]|nr:response regulator [Chloroflexota bacterium]
MTTSVSIRPEEATVVAVEDNFQNFVLIARLLAYLGVKDCQWKASGWQILEFAESLPEVDLILMDIFLPEADGYQALDRLRRHPRFQDTLIVAVTADASVQNMERARKAGFDGFIGKPLDPDRFPDQIRRVLRGEAVWEIE